MSVHHVSREDKEDVFLSSRFGDLEDVQAFVNKYGGEVLSLLRDDNGNTILHMVSANGHVAVLDYLLTVVPPSLLGAQNHAQSTPLHWAALNSHLGIMQKLVDFSAGPGIRLIEIKNGAGRTPFSEAESAAFDEGAKWLLERVKLYDVQEEIEDVKDG